MDYDEHEALRIFSHFSHLFQGRLDVYGTWTGGCVSAETLADPLWDHLHNGPYIGVYPLCDDNHVWWGCIDIDGKDHNGDWDHMWTVAATIQDVLAYKEVTCWLERTANGIHVWVFAAEPVPAYVMRQALLVACDVASYRPKEVNPKQTEVTEAKPYGNYVRLPYYGTFKSAQVDRFIVDEDGRLLSLEEFSRSAMADRVPVELLYSMSDLYTPPAVTTVNVDTDLALASEFLFLQPILPTVVKMIFEDGPLNGDRSAALVKTAVILRDEGWQAQAAYTVVNALDDKLMKFTGRDDREAQLLSIIEMVYG